MLRNEHEREQTRNALLRRADWRFLLPNPMPERVISFADAQLTRAVQLIYEQSAMGPASVDREGQYELAVCSNPRHADLTAAWSALSPGGVCYCEWKGWRPHGLRRTQRRLESAGFVGVCQYWPWPPPSRGGTVVWLPIEKPGVARYFLATRPPVRGALTRAARWITRHGVQLALRLGLTVPLCVVTRKPGDRERAHPGDGQSRHPDNGVTMHDAGADAAPYPLHDWLVDGRGGGAESAAAMLLTGGARSVSKVILALFVGGEGTPRRIVKLPRTREASAGLATEAATLRLVQQDRPRLGGVPRVVFTREYGGLLGVGETALTGGVPLWTVVGERSFPHLAQQATHWLIELAGRGVPVPASQWWDRLITPMLIDFTTHFGPTVGDACVATVRHVLSQLSSLPLVCEHRDFSPWNIFVHPSAGLLVFDWESSEPQGFPTADLIYFFAYLAFFLDGSMARDEYAVSYRALLDSSTFTGRVMDECMSEYIEAVGVDAACLPALRLAVWLRCSAFEYRRLVADSAGPPDASVVGSSRFLALIREELRLHADGTPWC